MILLKKKKKNFPLPLLLRNPKNLIIFNRNSSTLEIASLNFFQGEPNILIPQDLHQQYTLVLDADVLLAREFQDIRYGWRVSIRDNADDFIELLTKHLHYEVVFWSNFTMADDGETYHLEFDQKMYIYHHLLKDMAIIKDGQYIKNLEQLGRKMNNVIAITCHNADVPCLPTENCIYIKKYDPTLRPDYELDQLRLSQFLKALTRTHVDDVRPLIKLFNETPMTVSEIMTTVTKEKRKTKESSRKGFVLPSLWKKKE